ncbi:hypothetical protein J1605_007725 [Eschrichtius robustus]|uniref:Uncharacterized protein n=1 Tax=Eschrichtius robustus TaxID=9764 RepID=A0AB34H0C9_ESCRO|nr:hypothetical protein J1605_007725 [Eschrichtius robustus]
MCLMATVLAQIQNISDIAKKFVSITAEVLVVTSFDELQRRAPEARGKIVVYNQPYTNYSRAVQYRVQGAVEAAKVGALASLIRSVASFSIYSRVDERLLVLQPGIRAVPLRWESQLQDTGPQETSQLHVIPNGKNLSEISISTSRPSITQ